MRILWLVALVVVYFPLIVLISMNWNDEKVRDIGFSILLVGGTVGLISVWNSLSSENRTQEFSSSFVVLKNDPSISINRFVNSQKDVGTLFPEDHFHSILAEEYHRSSPKEFNQDPWQSYRDIVNYVIIEELRQTFAGHWLVDVKSTNNEIASFTRLRTISAKVETDTIEWTQIQKIFPSQIFHLERHFLMPPPISLKVPKGTKIIFKEKDEKTIILLENRYTKIEIIVSFEMYGPGFGKTGLYLNLPDSAKKDFINLSYNIMINSESKKIYSGSLESKHQKTWIKSIENILRNRLDFSIYLDKVKEWHRLESLTTK
jgi:hypothetical protein